MGLPLGAAYCSKSIWDLVIEKFKKYMVKWKSKYMSWGGRLVLFKSTLSDLLVSYMSLFTLLISVVWELESLIRNFHLDE